MLVVLLYKLVMSLLTLNSPMSMEYALRVSAALVYVTLKSFYNCGILYLCECSKTF